MKEILLEKWIIVITYQNWFYIQSSLYIQRVYMLKVGIL